MFNNFSIPLELLWGLLAVGLLVFLVVSAVLNYHWRYYGIKDNPKVFAKTIYWMVSFILIGIMTISLASYEASIIKLL